MFHGDRVPGWGGEKVLEMEGGRTLSCTLKVVDGGKLRVVCRYRSER